MNAIDNFIAKLETSLRDATFARLVLSGPTAAAKDEEKVLCRLITLRGVDHLTVTIRHATRDVTRNIPVAEVANWVRSRLGTAFRSALLGTTARDWQLSGAGTDKARVVGHKPAVVKPPSREHDRPRDTVLDESARDWLQGLDVVNRDGNIKPSMAGKWTQINRYLDIFTHLAGDCDWRDPHHRELTLADMGSGKGYLTFGLWHLFHRAWNQPARILGVESRIDLVTTTNTLAQKIGAKELEFVQGTIESVTLPRLDGLIALHACNTATDDAILRGIDLGAALIVVAPCCHQQLRPQLGRPRPLADVLRHGLMAERMAEWATDGLRILFLEWAGYRVKAIEFVGSEHTPKNLMLVAIRKGPAYADASRRHRIVDFKAFFGFQNHRLDPLLDKTPVRR
jgi:hypothetical protein